jgi:hypothetical protein
MCWAVRLGTITGDQDDDATAGAIIAMGLRLP